MAAAEVGDDVYGEDPTVNELENLAAHMVAKEAGLLVASGTMGNIAAILSHTSRGDEAIVGIDSHTFNSEAGGMSTIAGIVPRPLMTDDIGRMDISQIKKAIRSDDPHYPRSKLILLENSYGKRYGAPQPPEYFNKVRKVAGDRGLSTHLDGARIFNASVALDIDVTEITRHVDSVSFCLSKGLCAPIGSLLCGSEAMIYQARRARKVLGGGMRQAGIIASAGIIALNEMVSRLADDHRNARYLAQKLAKIPEMQIEVKKVRTNIVFFELSPDIPYGAQEVVDELWRFHNIRFDIAGHRRFRALTHYWVGEQEVDLLIDALIKTLSRLSSKEGNKHPGGVRTS